MKCPACNEKMRLTAEQITYNSPEAKNKYYKRSTYHCEKDDIWVTVEIPQPEGYIA